MYYTDVPTAGSSLTNMYVWTGWNSGNSITNVGTSLTSVTGLTVWYSWNANIATGSAMTSNIWVSWNDGYSSIAGNVIYAPQVKQRTPEEQAADQARWREEMERSRREMAEQDKKRQEIEARAHELLLEFLDEHQKKEYQEKKYFHLEVLDSKTNEKKRYRIEKGFAGNVRRVDEQGKILKRYCIHTRERLPDEDCMLTQKLLLETNEEHFLRVANAS